MAHRSETATKTLDVASRIFVGTAAWSIPREWASAFPAQGTGLEKYAASLGATEINSTFYRRHRPSTFERWRDAVPDEFRFAVKLPRWITHEAALASPRVDLRAFFDDVAGLREKLGPVLVQLPASLPFETRRVTAFFRALRSMHDGPVVCEPRNASFYTARATAVFVEHDVARVVADPARPPDAAEPGGASALVYFRWHGSPDRYWSSYDGDRLAALSRRVRASAARCSVWCIFDNTAAGAATGNAVAFRKLIDER
ncbi:MAG TPA: DUF72 domain-containing protein [Polyangiaceae bacterium]|jgi:uncharacterized protein YecE (DUF72 family)|nr:DUF72 domain-containing protein [Polyangiaceae bacterium]